MCLYSRGCPVVLGLSEVLDLGDGGVDEGGRKNQAGNDGFDEKIELGPTCQESSKLTE